MEMRRCKECGKLFMPKSVRSQYCEDVHYRPCPVCGKPVIAKYLSDPPRCCSKECQQAQRSKTIQKSPQSAAQKALVNNEEVSINFDDLEDGEIIQELQKRCYMGVYSHKSMFGFHKGNKYALNIKKDSANPSSAYQIKAIYDVTDRKPVSLYIPLTSPASIERYFGIVM